MFFGKVLKLESADFHDETRARVNLACQTLSRRKAAIIRHFRFNLISLRQHGRIALNYNAASSARAHPSA